MGDDVAIEYKMTISRLTVDKLGVKLYDKVSAVIAELIANSYDADATCVRVAAPMGQLLATKTGDIRSDKGYTITVQDDGIGMTPDQINAFYLKVGAERRADPQRGNLSKTFRRKVMGRKGVGKLAPFGICSLIEVLSAGGPEVAGVNSDGQKAVGYRTAHFFLERDKILEDTDTEYRPRVGALDGTVSPATGTTLRLTDFAHRFVPDLVDFERQLAQRFGIATADWRIELIDTTKLDGSPDQTRDVGAFSLEKMASTEIRFELTSPRPRAPPTYRVTKADGTLVSELVAGFTYDGTHYPVTGWVAYSKQPYRDDLMAGVRIYCRGKIAAQTAIFNHGAGFHGEYDIRSYLVGELHADWLDEHEDLIQTDRRDILWSHELGKAFETWGQDVVLFVGKMSRQPLKKKIWERFQEVAKIDERIAKAFPREDQEALRGRAAQLAKMVGQSVREESLDDEEHIEALVRLALTLAPHLQLDEMLRAAGDADNPISVISGLLKTARIAELSSFGSIAEDRVRIIERVEQLTNDPEALESAFQDLLSQAPWLINAEWSPVTANQGFETLRKALQKLFKERTKKDLVLEPFGTPRKRADFILSAQDGVLQLVEIKQPGKALPNDDMDRLNGYLEILTEFFERESNKEFRRLFPEFRMTLVCDDLALTGVSKTAFEGLRKSGMLTHITWQVFLLRTRRMHESFLKEAERQRKDAAKA
jgi:hypothetical protein